MTPQRIQLRRTKGWRKPEGAIVVARPSKWGNPYRIANACQAGGQEHALVVLLFRRALEARREGFIPVIFEGIEHYPGDDEICSQLAGRDLACWCPPDVACHADVLIELANGGDR